MKRILQSVSLVFVIWLGYGIYISIKDHPKVIWKDDEIVDIKNCDRPNRNYNTRCSKIYCEYELSKSEDTIGFSELRVIQIISTSLKPGESNHLAEVTLSNGKTYFACEMNRNNVVKLKKTTKDEFEFENDI